MLTAMGRFVSPQLRMKPQHWKYMNQSGRGQRGELVVHERVRYYRVLCSAEHQVYKRDAQQKEQQRGGKAKHGTQRDGVAATRLPSRESPAPAA